MAPSATNACPVGRRRSPLRDLARAVLLAAGIATASLPARSTPDSAPTPAPAPIDEYHLKAAFLERFLAFVHWPPPPADRDSPGPHVLGVVGKNPFGPRVAPGGRAPSESFRHLRLVECRTAEEAARCHIVFFAGTDESQARAILRDLENQPVLTVGEGPGFARGGGMISMIAADRRIRLEINVDQARRSGLRLDPQLLKLATLTAPARP